MKGKVNLITLSLLMMSVAFVNAQSPDNSKYAFVISKINYLKAIEDAVEKSTAEGIQISEARVILCGESVKALTENNPIVTKALEMKLIKLYACGLSLDQMKVDPKLLPKGVSLVHNGILEGMKLEKDGYKLFDL
jgi:intracellular sulfur oxidation DsrE/DsrF family protein